MNGGGYAILVEPLVVSVEYRLQWVRPKIDLVELADRASCEAKTAAGGMVDYEAFEAF
ncbi:MAG: hypothetical protein AB1540_18040 [Bdellovibrionota bacterium]